MVHEVQVFTDNERHRAMMPTIGNMVADLDFWDSVALALLNAFFTAFLIVFGVQRFQNRAQRKQTEKEEKEDLARRVRWVQTKCVGKATSLAISFYAATEASKRQAEAPDVYGEQDKEDLTATYHKWFPKRERFEHELRFLYGRGRADDRWHKVADLLTARYLHVLDKAAADNFRVIEKGTDDYIHSGLSVRELEDYDTVISTYGDALNRLIDYLTKNEPRVDHVLSNR
jgi:hypothetical protein